MCVFSKTIGGFLEDGFDLSHREKVIEKRRVGNRF